MLILLLALDNYPFFYHCHLVFQEIPHTKSLQKGDIVEINTALHSSDYQEVRGQWSKYYSLHAWTLSYHLKSEQQQGRVSHVLYASLCIHHTHKQVDTVNWNTCPCQMLLLLKGQVTGVSSSNSEYHTSPFTLYPWMHHRMKNKEVNINYSGEMFNSKTVYLYEWCIKYSVETISCL